MSETNDPRAQEAAAAQAQKTEEFHARMEEAMQPLPRCRAMFTRFMCDRDEGHEGKHRTVVEWGDSV